MDSLVSGVFPLENAASVYDDLTSGALNGVGFLLEYPAPAAGQPAAGDQRWSLASPAAAARARRSGGRLAVGFIGAGNYASRCCCRTWPS